MSAMSRVMDLDLSEDTAQRSSGDAHAGVENLRDQLERGLGQLAQQWPGISDAERQRMHEQLLQWTAPLANVLAEHPPMMQVFSHQVDGSGFAGVNFMQQFFGPMAGAPRASAGRTGAPAASVSAFLDSRATGEDTVEDSWQCPICFDGTKQELVAICRGGGPTHAFHRECVEPWLLRRNDCPTCRREPVVELGTVHPADGLGP